jgi:hypothetical protein
MKHLPILIIKSPLAFAASCFLLISGTASAQWAVDPNSKSGGKTITPLLNKVVNAPNGFLSSSVGAEWSGYYSFEPKSVVVSVSGESYAAASFHRASCTNLSAIATANSWANATWRWYGVPGASPAVVASLDVDLSGTVSSYSSVSSSPGGSASASAHAYGQGSNSAGANNGYIMGQGYAMAYTYGSAGRNGSSFLEGPNSKFLNPNASMGYGWGSAWGYYVVKVTALYNAPAGMSAIAASASGGMYSSATANSYLPPGGNLNMGGGNASGNVDGYSRVDLVY